MLRTNGHHVNAVPPAVVYPSSVIDGKIPQNPPPLTLPHFSPLFPNLLSNISRCQQPRFSFLFLFFLFNFLISSICRIFKKNGNLSQIYTRKKYLFHLIPHTFVQKRQICWEKKTPALPMSMFFLFFSRIFWNFFLGKYFLHLH